MIVWRRSTRSSTGATDPNCVELAAIGAGVAVRDSKNTTHPYLSVPRSALAALAEDIKTGRYDR